MAIRRVQLDDEAEEMLREVRAAAGLSISEALRRGLRYLQERMRNEMRRTPFDVYRKLDLSPGGYAVTSSTRTRRAVRRVVRKKLGR
jgi:hypothetical protein